MRLRKVAIIGVGLMGGSFALAIKEAFKNIEVVGYARSKKSYFKLKKLNILDDVKLNLEEVVKDADLVILSTPIYIILEYLKKISKFLKKDAIVIDLGSTKELIEKEASKLNINFVGCHPICGSEKNSAIFSDKNLYKNSICFITSLENSSLAKFIKKIWDKLGAKVIFISPSLHDKILSSLSHLVHIIAFSLVDFIPKEYLKFSTKSFKDLTRIAASSKDIWTDIFLSNRKNIIKDIKRYIKNLEKFKSLLEENNYKKIYNLIDRVNNKYKFLL